MKRLFIAEKNYYSLGECKNKGNREEFGEVSVGPPSRKLKSCNYVWTALLSFPQMLLSAVAFLIPKLVSQTGLCSTRRLWKSVLMGLPIHSVNACFDRCGAVRFLHFRDWFLIYDKNPGQLRGISLTYNVSFSVSVFRGLFDFCEQKNTLYNNQDVSNLFKY